MASGIERGMWFRRGWTAGPTLTALVFAAAWRLSARESFAEQPAAPATIQPSSFPGLPGDVAFQADVIYGTGGSEDLKLNLAWPKTVKDGQRLPCVLVIHGGAWRGGDRAVHNDLVRQFAQHGYVAATVGYRLAPRHPFPAQVEDVKCAVRYLRAHADEHRIDPERFGAVGFSAGAHLSMLLCVMDEDDGLEGSGGWADQSSQVQAAVAIAGPTDLTRDLPDASDDLVRDFIGGALEEKRKIWMQASPITYVTEGDGPMLLFQGTADPLVPTEQAWLMAQAMANADVDGRVEILLGEGHGWGGEELARTAEAMFEFFDGALVR